MHAVGFSVLKLISFVDSSFSDIGENGKSTEKFTPSALSSHRGPFFTAGMIQYLGYSPIYWETFVANTTIPLSTAEAEYVAAHAAGKIIYSLNFNSLKREYPYMKTMKLAFKLRFKSPVSTKPNTLTTRSTTFVT